MHTDRRFAGRLWTAAGVASALTLLAACTHPESSSKQLTGAQLYATCVACHKVNGEGDVTLAAPALAGLPAWYIEAQIAKFQTSARGAHPDDLNGLKMRPMSRQLINKAEVAAVATYIATLPAHRPVSTLPGGDAEAGKVAYAPCVACHGVDGKGLVALNGPPLVYQSDWYIFESIQKFKSGIRGTAPGDVTGAQMRPMSMLLQDDQAIKNVVAYIGTLNNERQE